MDGIWSKAREAATDARILIGAERFDAAANRAYYAMFNAARALLGLRGVKPAAAKRHATVLRKFSSEYVVNGPFDRDDGHALRLAGDARVVADYDEIQVTRAKAEAVLRSMEEFMRKAELVMTTSQGETTK
jgi:uncharacterized protein (UPF0332 family)